jgi:RNA polymerase sigma-70 factor (ECF subfamily)
MVDLKACLSGDQRAWAALVEQAAPILFAAVLRTLHQYRPRVAPGEAEDLAQDVFVRLIEKDYRLLRTYDPARASLSTWLTLVARSTVLNHLRKGNAHIVPLAEAPEHLLAVEESAPGDATRELEVPDGLLSPRQHLVLRLLFDRQMSVEEAAATLGVDAQTVRSTKHKAIAKLREFFKDR